MQRGMLCGKQKLRVMVFVTQPPHLYVGGVETRIKEVSLRLSSLVNTTVVSASKRGFNQPTTIKNTKYLPCFSTDAFFPVDNWVFNKSLTYHSNKLVADVYECHNVSAYNFFKQLKRKHKAASFISTIHGPLADEHIQAKLNPSQTVKDKLANFGMYYLSTVERDLAQQASTIVTVSRYSLGKIVQYYDVQASKITVIPNGVDCNRFRPSDTSEATKAKMGLTGKPCVLFVGQLIPRKGLTFLVSAAKQIVAERKETFFLIAGDGPMKTFLVNTLTKLGLLENFIFLGNVTGVDLVELYNCADVFVLPSVTEGQGIVLLEAQAVGKPVVAFNVGAISENVLNGKSGLLVNPNSDSLAHAILQLLSNPPLRRRMGEHGRVFVEKNYSWDLCASRMLALYTKLGA
jgi:glycosyltransferase involved in cell wall biosynthesis